MTFFSMRRQVSCRCRPSPLPSHLRGVSFALPITSSSVPPEVTAHAAIIPELCIWHLVSQEAAKQKVKIMNCQNWWHFIISPGLFFNGGTNFIFPFLYVDVHFHETRRNLIISGILMNLINHFKAEVLLSFDRQKHFTKQVCSQKPHLLEKIRLIISKTSKQPTQLLQNRKKRAIQLQQQNSMYNLI